MNGDLPTSQSLLSTNNDNVGERITVRQNPYYNADDIPTGGRGRKISRAEVVTVIQNPYYE